MPVTINGIGTHYYGSGNKSVINGTCRFCGKWAALSFYDTLECFCFLFIPLIPLRRYRIQFECGSCRKHLRSPLKDFKARLEETISPLRRQVERNPRDADAQLALINAYLDFALFREAEAAAATALTQSQDPRILLLSGQLAHDRGDLNSAVSSYRQVVAASPNDPGPHLSMARALYQLRQYDEVVKELLAAQRLHAEKNDYLYLLGESYFALGRWPEALDAYQQLGGVNPALANDRDLLLKIKACKQKLGYPLTEQEQKAKKRWFSSSGSSPAGKTQWARLGLVLGVLVAGGAAIAFGYSYWHQQNITIYFDNGFAKSVTVELDGKPFSLLQGPPQQRTLAPGEHLIRVLQDQKEIERYKANLEPQTYVEALFHSRFFVYNVKQARIYRSERVGYSTRSGGGTYSVTYVAFKQFFSESNFDYVFEEAPQTITMDSHASEEIRTAFNILRNIDYNEFAVMRLSEGKEKEAEQGFRKAIELDSCYDMARGNLTQFLLTRERTDEALAQTRDWLSTCGDSDLEANRSYQNVLLSTGEVKAVLDQYQERLNKDPENAANHYLYGRLIDDPEQSFHEQQKAISLDPELTWAHIALGHDFLSLERYSESMAELEAALQLPDCSSLAQLYFAHAAIGAGQAERAGKVLEKLPKDSKRGRSHEQAVWCVKLAQQQWKAADELIEQSSDNPKDAEPWNMKTQVLRLKGEEEPIEKWLRAPGSRKQDAYSSILFERLFEKKQYAEAGKYLEDTFGGEGSGGAPLLYRLYAAAGFLLSRDQASANRQLNTFDSDMSAYPEGTSGISELRAMADALRGNTGADSVIREVRKADYLQLKHAFFFLGVRAMADGKTAEAQRWFGRSQQACLDLDFPLFALRALQLSR